MPLSNRDAALTDLRVAMKTRDAKAVSDAASRLIFAEPVNWRQLLHHEGVFPNANALDLEKQLPFFAEVARELVTADALAGDALDTFVKTFLAVLDLGTRLDKIRSYLEKAPFFSRALSTQMYRLALLIETQSWLLEREVRSAGAKGEYYDTIAALRTSHRVPETGEAVSPVQSWENMVDAADLILRFSLRQREKEAASEINYKDSPYDSPDVQEALLLAIAWNDLGSLWADVKLDGWLPEVHGDIHLYRPSDTTDLHRRYVSIVRANRFQTQEMARYVADGGAPTDTPTAILKLGRTIRIPAVGQLWDGIADGVQLRAASTRTGLLTTTEFYVKFRHYGPLIASLSRGMGSSRVTWDEWLKVRNCLAVLGEAYTSAIKKHGGGAAVRETLAVAPVAIKSLAATVAASTGMGIERCTAALDFMTFSYGRRHLTIYDQPLLPVDRGVVLFVSSILRTGVPIYALENFVTAEGIGDFSARGLPFERHLASELADKGLPAVADLWVTLPDGRQMNYDLVVWWQGHLILLEAKCVKGAFTNADDFSIRSAVDKSIEQLESRRGSLVDFWPALVSQVPQLGLPASPPPSERVACISVTNSMRFTGRIDGNVICTDDHCLLRYFQDELDPVYTSSRDGNTLVGYTRNRPPGPLSPAGWIAYLRDPPQTRSLAGDVHIRYRYVTALPDETSAVAMPILEYSGTMQSMIARLQGGLAL